MGSAASASLKAAAQAASDDFEHALAWNEAVLDSVVILGDCAIMGASALGYRAMELAVPFSERGERKLACIVDGGQAELWYRKFAAMTGGCLAGKDIDIWIILMPSVDSDPCFYGSSLTQSILIPCLACSDACSSRSSTADVRLVHRDFYFANPIGSGFEWSGFLANDAKILPGSKRHAMKAWLDSWSEFVYGQRAGMYYATMLGYDEEEIQNGMAALDRFLKEGKPADDSAYSIPGSLLMVMITLAAGPDGDGVQVACTNAAGDEVCSKLFKQSDSLAELATLLREDLPESGPPTFWQGADEVPANHKIADYKELTAQRPLLRHSLADVVQFPQASVRFCVGDCHGLAKELSFEQFKFDEQKALKWKDAGADVLFMADVESLSSEFDQEVEQLRETMPDAGTSRATLTLVVIAKDFGSFKHPNFVLRLSKAVELFNICVFATLDDIDKIKSVYLKSPAFPNGQCLCQAMVPYPRIKFFCLLGSDGKTCGRELRDASLMCTSVKFGADAPTLPKEKLHDRQYIVGPGDPIHFVTVPGESKATFVTPHCVLQDVLRMAIQAGCTEGDSCDQEEALGNIKELRSSYKDIRGEEGEASDWDEVPKEKEAPPEEPDGSLESAKRYVERLGRKPLAELRSLGHPPPCALLPCKAAAVLLDVEVGADEWKSLQQMMADGDFAQKLLDIKPDTISTDKLAKVRALATDADFTYERQKRASVIAAALAALILALIK